jgi:hypothetical protein
MSHQSNTAEVRPSWTRRIGLRALLITDRRSHTVERTQQQGFEPLLHPRGIQRAGAHTLGVRVKRTGLDVRARRGYVWRTL